MAHQVQKSLLELAQWRLNAAYEKDAFVPSDPVAAAGGAAGGDPAAGGAPPDPAAGGDPAAAGAPPPVAGPAPAGSTGTPPPVDPMASMQPMIMQMIQQTLQQM